MRAPDLLEAAEREWRSHAFRCMNTDVEVMFDVGRSTSSDDGGDAHDPIAFAHSWFTSVETRFSRFLPDSELSKLNRSGGRPFLASTAMMELLQLAEQYNQRTGGVFSPLVLHALEQAGYDRSFDTLATMNHLGASEGIARVPKQRGATLGGASAEGIAGGQPPALASQMRLDASMGAVTLAQGVGVDLGGLAKGWAAERLAAWLTRHWGSRHGLVNAGGDVRVWGGIRPGEPWHVAVADPWRPERDAAMLPLTSGAMATSSVLGRRWQTAGGAAGHHLIDPRTGQPADSDIVQCSVSAEDLVACEIAAKTICILGSTEGPLWLQSHFPEARVLWFTKHHQFETIGNGWEEIPL